MFKKNFTLIVLVVLLVIGFFVVSAITLKALLLSTKTELVSRPEEKMYWFILHRKSNKEEFLYGIPDSKKKSKLIKTFTVKTGILGERPTPLPQLLGRKYWKVIKKEPSDNPETAPFFLTLDIPAPTDEPYGPVPYKECDGKQCSWVLPGAFGLHGIASNPAKLSLDDPGSSGCIRHSDEDITYLYNILRPEDEEIRYYIENN